MSLLTKAEVARRAGVTPAAVRLWADRGRLAVERTRSGIRLFRSADVEQFLRARRRLRARRSRKVI